MDKLINENILIDLQNEKIDFVAIAISHWHALGIEAFLYDISIKLERKVNGIILILPHPKDGFVINEKDFHCCEFANLKYYFDEITPENQKFIVRIYNFTYDYLRKFLRLHNIRSNNGLNTLYLVCPLLPDIPLLNHFEDDRISSKYNPVFVLVDEGFGTYVSKKIWNMVTKEDKTYSSFIDLMSSKIFSHIDQVFIKIVLRYIPIENRFLFKKEIQLKINEDICKSYKCVLKLRRNGLKINKSEKSVIIITDPLSEYNIISEQEEIHLIESLVKFINEKGIKPILKPHPREKNDKYIDMDCDFEIMKKDFPVEEIIPTLNPICVIGYTSTALLNSNVFYGITAISLSNILLLISDNKPHNASIKEFKKLTSNFINFINDIEGVRIFI